MMYHLDTIETLQESEKKYIKRYLEGFKLLKTHRFEESLPKFTEVAQHFDDLQIKLTAQKNIATAHAALGFTNKAIDSLFKYIALYTAKVPEIIEIELKTRLGVCYNEVEQFDKAAKVFHEIKERVEGKNFAWKNQYNYSYLYNVYGLLLHNIEKYDSAIEMYSKAYALDIEKQQLSDLAKTYNNLSNSLQKSGNRQAAIDTLHKAIELNKKLGRSTSVVTNYYNIAYNFYEQYCADKTTENFEKSEQFFKQAITQCELISFDYGIMYNGIGLGALYFEAQKYSDAKPLLVKSYQIAKTLELKHDLLESLRLLTLIERQNVNSKEFTTYFDAYMPLAKIIQEEKIQEKVNELIIRHEVEEKEIQNLHLQQTLAYQNEASQKNKLFIFVLVVLLLLVIIVSFTLYRSSKKLNKANELLKNQTDALAIKNKELSDSITDRDHLAHTIIHDLRTPLVGIKGSLGLLDSAIDDQTRKEVTQLLGMSYANLDILISSLLSSYQNENAKIAKGYTPTEMKNFMEQVTKGFEVEAAFKNIVIEKDFAAFTTKIKSDAVYGIVGNLLSNAVKYSPQNTKIVVKTAFFGSFWRFSISDQGPGFTPEDQNKIFERFANLSSQPTNNEKSTGIGLFSVKKSVDSLKGTIELHNNPGKGATFVCQFPVNS